MWSFELTPKDGYGVLDSDGAVVSTHATEEAAMTAALADVVQYERDYPLDVKEGHRLIRNIQRPNGTRFSC